MTDAVGGGVTSVTGTSASAAVVAGAAGVLAASDDTASPGTIVGRLARSAAAAGTADQTGNGRLDLARAVADTDTSSVKPAGAAPVADGGPLVGPYVAASNATVTGTVKSSTAGNPPIGGATVACVTNCSDPSVTTNASGLYSLPVNYAGNDKLTLRASARLRLSDAHNRSRQRKSWYQDAQLHSCPFQLGASATVVLSPTGPSTNQTVTATATRSDPDRNTVTLAYVWKVNGTVVKTTSGSSR